jgi:hypothetical protein
MTQATTTLTRAGSDMFVKITTSGPRQYVKLVKAYRDESGVSRQRVIATLVRAGKCRTWVYRVLRMRLKASQSPYSPERALEVVRRIQFHQVTLHQREAASGLTRLTPEQKELFDAVSLPEPSHQAL